MRLFEKIKIRIFVRLKNGTCKKRNEQNNEYPVDSVKLPGEMFLSDFLAKSQGCN